MSQLQPPSALEEALEKPHPTFTYTKSRSNSATSSHKISSPSERFQHFAGDIPPSLSPLDAFAAHSRKLAKELDETRKAGQRRISRLPPHVVTESLTQHQAARPHYFRSTSGGSSPTTQDAEGSGTSPEVTEPSTRPISSYPRLDSLSRLAHDDDGGEVFSTPREVPTTAGLHQTTYGTDYFGSLRAESPEAVEQTSGVDTFNHVPNGAETKAHSTWPPSRMSQPDLTFTLAPPNAPFARNTNHNRLHESSDDDNTSSNAGSTFSQARKLSSSSGVSMPHSPMLFSIASHVRSPSINSDKSAPSPGPASRARLNFSRPISSTSLHNLHSLVDSPSRQQSKRSEATYPYTSSLDPPRTPISFDETRARQSNDHGNALETAALHLHDQSELPRGRMADRESAVFLALSTPHFEWQEPMFPSTPPLTTTNTPSLTTPSPPHSARPSRDEAPPRPGTAGFSFDFGSEKCHTCERPRRPKPSHSASSSIHTTPSSAPRPSTSHGSSSRPVQPQPAASLPKDEQSLSSRSNSTVRPQNAHLSSNYQSLTPDEHVSKAIDLHNSGSLNQSTYHLRIAAKQDHPTGMLLYALACRHGWGMRPNQREGVQWLRKAMDSAMLEVADDENPASETATKDFNERKTHRAQFALSIYELGVSHLNGWGTEQDKTLALRCFEIAGDWGDTDALSEAGFCYAEGIGCKKDLKKAAGFYRRAAEKGVSMVGNSWIYKEKYDNIDDKNERNSRARSKPSSPSKPLRSKSKTRSIFSRKKSASTPR